LYEFANELSERGKKKMEKKNISFSKEGMKVGIKDVKQESYEDKTQRFVVPLFYMVRLHALMMMAVCLSKHGTLLRFLDIRAVYGTPRRLPTSRGQTRAHLRLRNHPCRDQALPPPLRNNNIVFCKMFGVKEHSNGHDFDAERSTDYYG
jgi:hypothetical protein